jgi:hypothetical protein
MQPDGSLPVPVSCAKWVQSTCLYSTSLRSVLISPSYLRLCISSNFRIIDKMIYEWWARSGRGLAEILSPSCTWKDWGKPCETLLSLCPCLDSSVGIATGYWLDYRGVGVRVPVGSRLFFCPRRRDRFCGPLSRLSNGHRGHFSWCKAAGAWSWTLTSN